MATVMALAGILLTVLVGAMSPGPSFVTVARMAISDSRRSGVAAAVGMGVGSALFAVLAMLGLKSLLIALPWLYGALKVVGGGYLVYEGVRIWRGAKAPVSVEQTVAEAAETGRRAFTLALLVQLSNPTTIAFFGSIFAAMLPRTVPAPVAIALPPLVFVVETAWYGVVALVLSSSGSRSVYLRSKTWIDRTAGSLMGLLGLRLAASLALGG
ncbi:MAG TPA: LysE family transporter [Symbiobacteriaceae bacterium]|nr:LysE family transporter [Symbiobacteriaceae bacterium]